MEDEFSKHRRNLVSTSTLLLIYEVAGGKISGFSGMSIALTFERPQAVHYSAYLVLLYFLWRYWIFAHEKHLEMNANIYKLLKDQKCFRNIFDPILENFRKKYDLDQKEGFMSLFEDRTGQSLNPFNIQEQISYLFFSRKLTLTAELDESVNLSRVEECENLSFFQFEKCWAKAFINSLLNHKEFSNIFFPYLIAAMSLVAFLSNLLASNC